MNNQIKILVVGYGSIGKKHVNILAKLLPNSFVALLSSKTKDQIKNKFIREIFDSTDNAIKFKPSIVVISNPSTMHLSIAKKFLHLNPSFFIEKPFTASFHEGKNFLSICKKNNIKVLIGYNLKFLKSLKFLKKYIYSKKLGNLYSVRCEVGQFLPEWRSGISYHKSVSALKKLGGGVLLELSHELDYLLWLFDDLSLNGAYVNKVSNLNIDVEDCVHVLFTIKNSNDLFNKKPINLTMDFLNPVKTRYINIFFGKANIYWDLCSNKIFKITKKNKIIIFNGNLNEINTSYIDQWKYFFKIVFKNNNHEINTMQSSLKIIKIIDKIKLYQKKV